MSKTIFFTPGPSQLYPTVTKHIKLALKENIPSLSHRSSKYSAIQQEVCKNLRILLNIPDDYLMFVGGSATFFMEKIGQNLIEKNSFHFVNGAFSKKFMQICSKLGKNAQNFTVEEGKGFGIDKICIPQESELLAFTATETSTGVQLPQNFIYEIAKQNPKKLIALDVVSAIPYYQLDYKYIDAMFFSVQKGFGLPSGLGIAFCSPRAIEKSRSILDKGVSIGSYYGFPEVAKDAQNFQTPETPNVLDMYLLNKVIQDILAKGLDQIIQETESKAKSIYNFFEQSPNFKIFVNNQYYRSQTVIVIDYDKSKVLIDKLSKKGLILGTGYGNKKDSQFRIANFPAISKEKINLLLKEISQN